MVLLNILRKIKSFPLGVKSSASLFLARIISMGVAYITVPIFTRLLTTDEYGQVNVFLSWLNMFGVLAMFNLSAGVFNNGMVDYSDKRDEYSFSMLILSNIITVVFSALLFFIYPFIHRWIGLDWKLIVLMSIIFILSPAYNFWTARQRYEMKYKALLATSVLFAVMPTAVALICVTGTSGNRAYARIFGMECTSIAIYIVFYVILTIKGRRKIETKYWKAALLFNFPLLPHYFSAYMLDSSDRLMISHIVSDSATAFYSIAGNVASIAMVFWNAIQASLIPYTYEHCKQRNYKPISAVTSSILTLIAGSCIIVVMLAPEIVGIITTADYREAIYAIPPIVGGVIFQIQHGIYGNAVFYYKKPQYVMISTVVAAAFNLVLNYIFIPTFGFVAAGYTTMFSYFVEATIDYFAMRKVSKGIDIYNMKYIGILSIGIVILSLLSNFIYDYFIIRYVILVGILVICVVFRKKIMEIFKSMKTKRNCD